MSCTAQRPGFMCFIDDTQPPCDWCSRQHAARMLRDRDREAVEAVAEAGRELLNAIIKVNRILSLELSPVNEAHRAELEGARYWMEGKNLVGEMV